MLSFNLHQLIWSPKGSLLFFTQTFFYIASTISRHHSNECTIQQGNLPNLSSDKKLQQGAYVTTLSYINEALLNHTMERHTSAKSLSKHPGKAVAQYPWGAALGALDLIADVSFPGATMRFSFYLSAWSRGAGTGIYLFFIITVIILKGRDGCLAHNAAMPSVCYFCCW